MVGEGIIVTRGALECVQKRSGRPFPGPRRLTLVTGDWLTAPVARPPERCGCSASGAGGRGRSRGRPPAARRVTPAGAPVPVPFTLRLADGRARFHPGEIIPIELVFTSSIPDRFILDSATYD